MPVSLATVLRPRADQRSVVTGIVESVSTANVTATVDLDGEGSRVTVPYVNSAPSTGDVAVLLRSGTALWLIGVYDPSQSVPVPPPPDPDEGSETTPPPPSVVTVTLTPTATGTARGGSVRPDTTQLYQGDWTGRGVNAGQAVYRARQLSGTVTRVTLRIKRLDAGVYAAQSPTLRLMTQSSLVGNPTWQAQQTGPALKVGESATVTLPNDWGQKLINGQAGGIGIYVSGSSPYVRLAGKAQGFMTVTLRIKEN